MAKTAGGFTKGPEFRRQEEKPLRATQLDVLSMPITEIQQLVHELQDHEFELEMQNEELRRAQLEIERVRDRYMELYDSAPAAHLTLDTHCAIVEANLRTGTLLGINREELIGQPLARFFTSEDQDLFHRHCQQVLKTGTQQSCEVRLRDNGSATSWVQLESLPIHDESGPISQWRTALLDITERKRDEHMKSLLIKNLSRSQQHFQTLFNWTPSAVGISTVAEGRFLDVNEAFSRLTGYKREEMIGRTTVELGLWADPSERATVLQEIQERGHLHNREGLLRTKSGEIRSLMVSVDSIQFEAAPCLIYLAHDITERKQAEEALRLAKFSVDRAADAVYWVDSEAKILDVNEAACRMLNYSKEELCAMTIHDLNPDFQADMWAGFWAETQRRGTMVFETAHRARDGRLFPIEVSVNFLIHEGKEYHCAFVRDITERKRAEAALKASETRFRAIFDQTFQFIGLMKTDGTVIEANRSALQFVGIREEDVLGKLFWDTPWWTHSSELQNRLREAVRQAAGGTMVRFEATHPHLTGELAHVDFSLKPVRDEHGTVTLLIPEGRNITERKLVEEALRKSEERYRSIFENAVEGIFQTTPDGKYVAVNPALARIYGYDSPDDMIAKVTNLAGHLYVDPGRRDEFIRLMQEQEGVTGFEALVYRKDGSWIWVSEGARALRDPAGTLAGYEGTVEDVTERKLGEARLRATLEELRMLSERLATVREEEQTRIARELHDELGVGLTCLKVDLSRLRTIMGEPPGARARKKIEDKIKSMVEQVDATIASVQRIATELRPSILDDLGLVAAIEWQCRDFQQRTGIPCTCVSSADDIAMEPEQATSLFRICQEALTNTARHAQATAIQVLIKQLDNNLLLAIQDDGVGIPPEKLTESTSLGLLGMRERASSLGGEVTITGSSGKGTTVTVRVPLSSTA